MVRLGLEGLDLTLNLKYAAWKDVVEWPVTGPTADFWMYVWSA